VSGGLLIPLAYDTLVTLGASPLGAALAAGLLLCDTALAVQSRYILLDAPMLLAIAAAACAWARFRWGAAATADGWGRWAALLATGVCLGLATSIKWVGLFVVTLIGLSTARDLYGLLCDRRVGLGRFAAHFAARAVALIAVPLAIYALLFAAHLRLLNRPGPGLAFLPPALQAAHEAASPTAPKIPADVALGSEVMLRHVGASEHSPEGALLLHSHAQRYPAGSRQQQVTLSTFKDANSWWVVRPHLTPVQMYVEAGGGARGQQANGAPVKAKALVRLQHRATQAFLRASAQHAAPLSPGLWEVAASEGSGSAGGGASLIDPATVWMLEVVQELVPGAGTPNVTHAWSSVVQLRHLQTGCVLVSRTATPLPEWAAQQREVACRPPPGPGGAATAAAPAAPGARGAPWGTADEGHWVIDNHVNRRAPPDAPVAQRPTLPLWRQLWEHQRLMAATNEALVGTHPYQSPPADWPFLTRGIGYWAQDKALVYFAGNPAVWRDARLAVPAFLALAAAVAVAAQRGVAVRAHAAVARAERAGWFLFGGWALHYLPFFLMKRNLFLHHYLPALYFGVLLFGVLVDAAVAPLPRAGAAVAVGAVLIVAAQFGWRYYPLVVGDPVDAAACAAMGLPDSWRVVC